MRGCFVEVQKLALMQQPVFVLLSFSIEVARTVRLLQSTAQIFEPGSRNSAGDSWQENSDIYARSSKCDEKQNQADLPYHLLDGEKYPAKTGGPRLISSLRNR
jgi:hypothetical protein